MDRCERSFLLPRSRFFRPSPLRKVQAVQVAREERLVAGRLGEQPAARSADQRVARLVDQLEAPRAEQLERTRVTAVQPTLKEGPQRQVMGATLAVSLLN